MDRQILAHKLKEHLESNDTLGFDIGADEEMIVFLARLEMEVVEQLLGNGLTPLEREELLNWVEERKGKLPDHELPLSEARRRMQHRRQLARGRRRR